MPARYDTMKRRDGFDSERGAALILTLLVIMTLTVLGVGVIISTSTNKSLSRNYEVAAQARNMAEIGAKIAYREFITSGFLKPDFPIPFPVLYKPFDYSELEKRVASALAELE